MSPRSFALGRLFNGIWFVRQAYEVGRPNAGTILYEYDGWGNLKKQTDARGEVEEYTYENSGRLQSYKRGTETFSYAYDPTYKGQVGSITYGGAKQSSAMVLTDG